MINRLLSTTHFSTLRLHSPEGLSEGPGGEVESNEEFGGLSEDEAETALMGLFSEEGEAGGKEHASEGSPADAQGSAEGEGSGQPDDGSGTGNPEDEKPAGEAPGAEAQDAAGLSDDLTFDVNGTSVKLGELKALAGQAINLNSKGQEIAQKEQEIANMRASYAERLGKQKEFVDGLFQELAASDMAAIKAESTPEQWAKFSAYAQNIVKLHGELSEGLEAITPEVEKAQQEATLAKMQTCAKALLDPATGIPGYNQERHNANVAFAEKMGLGRDVTDSLSNPAAWKLLDYAHKYAELQERASKVAPKPSVPAPKTPALKNEGQDGKGSGSSDALARLRQTGSEDDAVEALMALGL